MKAGRPLAASALAALLVGGLAAALPSCATEEPVNFADAGQTPNGSLTASASSSSSSSSTSSGGSCAVDAGCAVSFKTDIYAAILDGTGNCTSGSCHATGVASGNLKLDPGAAEAAYSELLNYMLAPKSGMGGGPYVTPCDLGSRLLCNLAVEGSSAVPCGTSMPVVPVGKKLTQAQYDQIAEWITCGAPDN